MSDLTALAYLYSGHLWFLATWGVSLLAVTAIGMRWAHRNSSPDPVPSTGAQSGELRPTPALLFAAGLLLVFASAYTYLMFAHEELAGPDLSQLTATSFFAMPIWPNSGRFFPFGLQEYNIISLVGKTPFLFHGFSVVELAVLLASVFAILNGTPGWYRIAVMAFLMVVPSFVVSFFGLVYPERDLLFWLAVFVLCVERFLRTRRTPYLVIALVAAQFALYYKEPAFLLIGGFAFSRLLIHGWSTPGLLKDRRYAHFFAEHWLESGLLVLSAVFITLYFVLVGRHVQTSYVALLDHPGMIATLWSYARSDLLLDGFIIAFIWRTTASIVSGRAPDPLWEPLAIGALVYAAAFVKLQAVSSYYMAPVDFIGALYLGRVIHESLRAKPPLLAGICLLFVALAVRQNLGTSSSRIVNRKQYTTGITRLAGFLADYGRAHPQSNVTLYFPHATDFDLMEISAFLRFKGMRLLGDRAPWPAATATFVVKSPRRLPDDQCVSFRVFKCFVATGPEPGDLVVFAPGGDAPADEIDRLEQSATRVFNYRQEFSPLEKVLLRLVPADRAPTDWMQAHVFKY